MPSTNCRPCRAAQRACLAAQAWPGTRAVLGPCRVARAWAGLPGLRPSAHLYHGLRIHLRLRRRQPIHQSPCSTAKAPASYLSLTGPRNCSSPRSFPCSTGCTRTRRSRDLRSQRDAVRAVSSPRTEALPPGNAWIPVSGALGPACLFAIHIARSAAQRAGFAEAGASEGASQNWVSLRSIHHPCVIYPSTSLNRSCRLASLQRRVSPRRRSPLPERSRSLLLRLILRYLSLFLKKKEKKNWS